MVVSNEKGTAKAIKHTTLVLLWMASFMAARVAIYDTPPSSMAMGYSLQPNNKSRTSEQARGIKSDIYFYSMQASLKKPTKSD